MEFRCNKDPDNFIHFTKGLPDGNPKLGVNPSKTAGIQHKDPRGIFGYPCDWLLADNTNRYATNYPHWYILKLIKSDRGVDLKTSSYAQLIDIATANGWDYFYELFAEKDLTDPHVRTNSYGSYWYGTAKWLALSTTDHIVTSVRGSKLWSELSPAAKEKEEEKLQSIMKVLKRNWFSLIKGVSYILDPGMGVIHPNEPAQIVFIEPGSYKVLEYDTNVTKTDHVKKTELRKFNKLENENVSSKFKDIVDLFKETYKNKTHQDKGGSWLDRLVKFLRFSKNGNLLDTDLFANLLSNQDIEDESNIWLFATGLGNQWLADTATGKKFSQSTAFTDKLDNLAHSKGSDRPCSYQWLFQSKYADDWMGNTPAGIEFSKSDTFKLMIARIDLQSGTGSMWLRKMSCGKAYLKSPQFIEFLKDDDFNLGFLNSVLGKEWLTTEEGIKFSNSFVFKGKPYKDIALNIIENSDYHWWFTTPAGQKFTSDPEFKDVLKNSFWDIKDWLFNTKYGNPWFGTPVGGAFQQSTDFLDCIRLSEDIAPWLLNTVEGTLWLRSPAGEAFSKTKDFIHLHKITKEIFES